MAAVCSSSVPRGPDGSAGEGGWLSGMMFALSVLRSYVMPCGRGGFDVRTHLSEPPVAVVSIAG